VHLEAAGRHSTATDIAAPPLGKAVGLASLLEGLRPFLSKGISSCTQVSVHETLSVEALYTWRSLNSEGVQDVAFKMATATNGHLLACADLHG
jgi:hypothetical protein